MTGICRFFRQVPRTYHNSLKQMKHLLAVVLGHVWKLSLSEIQEKTHSGTNSHSILLPEKSPQDKPWSSVQYIRKTRQLCGDFWRVFWEKEEALRKKAQCAKTHLYFVLWESLNTLVVCDLLSQPLQFLLFSWWDSRLLKFLLPGIWNVFFIAEAALIFVISLRRDLNVQQWSMTVRRVLPSSKPRGWSPSGMGSGGPNISTGRSDWQHHPASNHQRTSSWEGGTVQWPA